MNMLSVKLKNEIMKVQSEGLDFHLKNISINGVKKGCSGFVHNTVNGKIVYVCTEGIDWIGQEHKNLYRTAETLKDYSGKGGFNQYANNSNIARAIVNLLK